MSKANAAEQYMLELINSERAKAGAQPLAFDGDLNESSENHSNWMIANDIFSHTGVGGSSPGDRMETSGYEFSGSWTWGENIAFRSTSAPDGLQDEVQKMHTSLMNSSGHRANILNTNFREIGIGIEVGEYQNFEAAFVTQNFARTASDFFLTGVAFDDQDNDNRYDIKEGLGNFTVTAQNNTTGAIFTTLTGPAGGYTLELASGNYTVNFSADGYNTWSQQVNIGNKNVKLDLIDPAADSGTPDPDPIPNPDSGDNDVNDTLQALVQDVDYEGADTVLASLTTQETNDLTSETLSILLTAGIRLLTENSDYLYNADSFHSVHALGGNDTILGGSNDSRLFGGSGNDKLYDYRGGNDYLFSGSGSDYLDAGDGDDILNGGNGPDTLIGGQGMDRFIFNQGDTGIDRIYMNIAEGDKLDISDLLSDYDPLTDVIDDFIQLTSDGFSTQVFVDVDGQGPNSATEIAFLYGTSGVSIHDLIDSIADSGTPDPDSDPTPNPDSSGSDLNDTLQTLVQNTDYEDVDTMLSDLSMQEIDSLTSETLSMLLNTGIRLLTKNGDYLYNTGSYHSVHALSGNDTVLGGSNDSRLFGGSGNDNIYDYRGGNDYLHGGDGNDYLEAGTGSDILYGGNESDLLIGGPGEDTYVFRQGDTGIDKIYMNIAEGDKLDISDLLSGYDPLTDAIDDFIQLTSDGYSTHVSIDANGHGAGNAINIATLVGVTGLDSANALEASGNLITM